jgi:4-aminobutyrate aminotransferase
MKEEDPQTPDPTLRDELVQAAFRKGLLLLGCGESAIRFCPPLCINPDQVETALQILQRVLASRRSQRVVA